MLFIKLILPLILITITIFPQALACSDFDCDALEEHNHKRHKHGSQEMKLDPELSKECEKDAKEKAKKKKCECDEEEEDEDDKKQTTKKPDEKPEDKPGENVCVTFGDPLCCIARWYREKKYYEYKKPKQDDPEMTKHFTQLVWNASNTLGCGMAKGNKGVKVVICRYKPKGNVEDKYEENVYGIFCRSERLKIWKYSNILVWYIILFVVSQFTLTLQS